MGMDSPKHTHDSHDNSYEGGDPSCLVVGDFPKDLFLDDELKAQFEELFCIYGPAYFTYLPAFQRIIVKYISAKDAQAAKTQLNGVTLDNIKEIKIFFKEEAKKLGDDFLALPKAQRLFLISPPASPPVGWEPVEEPIPVVNYDLLNAVAHLQLADKPVELVSKTDATPAIVVIGCEDPVGDSLISMKCISREELQTQRPPIK